MDTAYFQEYLPTLVGKPLVPGNEALSIAFNVAIGTDSSSCWCLVVEGGQLVAVRPEETNSPVTFRLGTEVFEPLVRGTLSPVDAFLDQRIVIEGDVEQGLVLGAILEAFFQQYPYED